jgi:hypothetical protein
MGHTHYDEIAHDGHAIYTATRSTGQIEEGPVGFSVTNLDHGVVSWLTSVPRCASRATEGSCTVSRSDLTSLNNQKYAASRL